MAAQGTTQVLRERIGNEATHTRITIMDESSRSMAEEIAQTVGDRFERRLTEEVSRVDRRLTEETSAVRIEMHKGFGELRAEMHDGFGALRAEMHDGFGALRAEMHERFGGVYEGFGALRAEMHRGFGDIQGSLMRWSFVFWVGQLGLILGLLAYLT